ncbi:nuclear transport factor 2 family protein [Zhongshania sp. BJYM1]|jgi:hypothetical protein|uniref:nuclear transport factor 2 family protein n=1 Tax=Zhongshania aquatica TaxID=2965069 RepID=UPI0022B49FFB|nr:nuclear transport factor 2 family protein [Marortus sp. BJYM1]
MSINLPKPIASYFSADLGDSETVAKCFTENAVVKDEGNTYIGQAAIKQWKADTSKKFTYTCEPFACEERDGKTIVTSRLTGNFPGSPVDLRYFFNIEGSSIASLEIIL